MSEYTYKLHASIKVAGKLRQGERCAPAGMAGGLLRIRFEDGAEAVVNRLLVRQDRTAGTETVKNTEAEKIQQRKDALHSEAAKLPGLKLCPHGLSAREMVVAKLVCEGLRSRDIASRLDLSLQVVKNYTGRIYAKLGVADRVELTRYMVENQLTQIGQAKAQESTT